MVATVFALRLWPAFQKQAVLVIKIVFQYLVDVRYLVGNPWSAVDLLKLTVAVIEWESNGVSAVGLGQAHRALGAEQ
jgi:hypothetical protein